MPFLNTLDHLNDGDLTKAKIIGLVVNNNDPTGAQRIQVRISALHQGVEDSQLPWCRPIKNSGSSAGDINVEVPKLGSIAAIYIPNEDDNTNMYYEGCIPLDNTLPEIVAGIFPNCRCRVDQAGNVFFTNYETNTIYIIHQSGGFYQISASGCNIFSTGNFNLKVTGNLNMVASGQVNISGSSVNLNPSSNPASSLTSMPQPAPSAVSSVANLTEY